MNNSKTKGNLGEIKAAEEFIRWGCTVSFPFGDNARYDLIVDINNKLYRVQIKYTSQVTENGSYKAVCVSSTNHTTNKKLSDYKLDVDLMVFYIAELDKCLIIPIDQIDTTAICFRTENPKNNQVKKIRLLEEYTFDKFFRNMEATIA